MKPAASFRTIVFVVVALALLVGLAARQASAQTRIDLDVKRAVVRIVPERSTAAGVRRVEDQPGSGVIIHPSGIVLTAWHVLSQDKNFSQRNYWDDFVVEVIEDDDSSPPVARYRAKIIAVRPDNDLALLRLDRDVDGNALTSADLADLSVLPVFTGSADTDLILDSGNTVLSILGYPKPFAPTDPSALYATSRLTLNNRSLATGELIVQYPFEPGYSGGPVLVEAGDQLVVAGIILKERGSRTVSRDLAERFGGFEWVAGEQNAFAQNVSVAELLEGNSRVLLFDLDVQSIGMEGAPVQLQINFYDASHRPWRPGAVGLSQHTDGSVYWEEDIRPDRPVAGYPVQVRFSLASLGVTAEELSFRLMLYDKSSGQQLWSGTTWYQAQPTVIAQADRPAAMPTDMPAPTSAPIPDTQAQIDAAVNARLTALAPTATATPTATNTPTATPTPNTTATFQAAVNAQLTALAPTQTPTATSTRRLLTSTPTLTPTRRPPRKTPTPRPTPTPDEPAAGATGEIDGITFVYVPAGEFAMGSNDGESDEKPVHAVYLDGYWVMRTEVTNDQFGKFVEAGGYTTERYWTSEGWKWRGDPEITEPSLWTDSQWNGAEQPVVGVSWYEAVAYANWLAERTGLALRLPTEAEWEKAARGTDGWIYPWGNGWDGGRLNYCDSNCTYDWADKNQDDGYQYTAPVGSYAGGVSSYGAYDMAGNVWEWAQDWYSVGYYAGSPTHNPAGPTSGESRVLRGGSWSISASDVRSANRDRSDPDFRYFYVGFRLVAPGN